MYSVNYYLVTVCLSRLGFKPWQFFYISTQKTARTVEDLSKWPVVVLQRRLLIAEKSTWSDLSTISIRIPMTSSWKGKLPQNCWAFIQQRKFVKMYLYCTYTIKISPCIKCSMILVSCMAIPYHKCPSTSPPSLVPPSLFFSQKKFLWRSEEKQLICLTPISCTYCSCKFRADIVTPKTNSYIAG